MTMENFKTPIFSLLLVSMFVTSCHGQTTTEHSRKAVTEQLSFTSKNTKLTKTQGSDKYQNVHCSLQDRDANLWFDGGEKINSIESVDGLWRYDGKAFKNFTTNDGMGKNSVWNMLEDHNGNIWIGTRNCGLYRYDRQTFTTLSE